MLMNRMILATTNKTTEKINDDVLKLLATEVKTYYSANSTTSLDEIHS